MRARETERGGFHYHRVTQRSQIGQTSLETATINCSTILTKTDGGQSFLQRTSVARSKRERPPNSLSFAVERVLDVARDIGSPSVAIH